jgi:hypothetical protein
LRYLNKIDSNFKVFVEQKQMSSNPYLAPLVGFLGVLLGSLISLLGTYLSHRYLIRRQQELWMLQREAEYEDWLREKLYEIYINCLYFAGSAPTRERDKWYNLLLAYFPATEDHDAFYNKIKQDQIEAIDIVNLASKDRRLKGDLGMLI